jgi:hypothetical protein
VFSCRKCALLTLIMLMNSAKWVMRRVERVAFHDDRSASRRVSTDFVVPGQAPRYQLTGGRTICLIPLTVMRRKTLVNFNLTDEDGRALSLVSLRHNQALTEQMVLVLAEITPGVEQTRGVAEFARRLAFGDQDELTAAFDDALSGTSGSDVERLVRDRGAERLLRRLANNFLLLVTVNDEGPARRIVRFSYDEPLTLTYKKSGYNSDRKEYVAEPRPLSWWHPARLATGVGLSPTVIRFPTPAAENTASYHFEIVAPTGVVIESASLVAGRPNERAEPSWDRVVGGLPVVGLHVVGVPNGSMSRAQVALRLSRRGWLTTTLFASALTTFLLAAVALAQPRSTSGGSQTSDIATALLTITAAVVAFVAKPPAHQMASRLVTTVRGAAGVAMILLLTIGASISFGWRHQLVFTGAACIAGICTLLVGFAFWKARPRHDQISPWEQGLGVVTERRRPEQRRFDGLEAARREFRFDRPAVMVESSEGDHREAFHWTRSVEDDLDRRLRAALDRQTPAGLVTAWLAKHNGSARATGMAATEVVPFVRKQGGDDAEHRRPEDERPNDPDPRRNLRYVPPRTAQG